MSGNSCTNYAEKIGTPLLPERAKRVKEFGLTPSKIDPDPIINTHLMKLNGFAEGAVTEKQQQELNNQKRIVDDILLSF